MQLYKVHRSVRTDNLPACLMSVLTLLCTLYNCIIALPVYITI